MKPAQDLESAAVSLLADRVPVDWEELRRHHPDQSAYLEQLRRIESVIRANEQVFLGASSSDPPSSPEAATAPMGQAPAHPLSHPPLRKWKRLELIELLGSGSYGDVWKAYDPVLERTVALKLRRSGRENDPGSDERFLTEARRLARVRHENVLTIHGADIHDGQVGIWTDYLAGRTLEEMQTSQGTFGYREAALIGMDLCRALTAVHGAGLVHRDVKPANVMRTREGRTVLLDFGAVTRDVSKEPDAEASGPMGTLLYLAPEILEGEPASVAADIYALGVLLFHLVSGDYPVYGRSVADIILKQGQGSRKPLRDLRPDIPLPFIEAVERAIAVAPSDRFPGAAGFERSLSAVLAVPEPPMVPSRTISRRTVFGWSLAGVSGAALVFLLAGRLEGELSAELSLYRPSVGGPEVLPPAARVASGDQIALHYRGSRKAYLYVVNEDSEGRAHRLFPLEELESRNPLAARVLHQIPGRRKGVDQLWTIGAEGSTETILAIASPRRLQEFEEMLSAVPEAVPMGTPLSAGDDVAAPDRLLSMDKGMAHYTPAPGGTSFLGDLEYRVRQEEPSVVIQRFNLSKGERRSGGRK